MERIICVPLLRRISAVEGVAIVLVQLQALGEAFGKIGVGNEPATEDDEIGIARLNLGRGIVAIEAAGGNELNAAFSKNLAESGEAVASFGFYGGFGFDACTAGVGGQGVHLGLFVEDFVEARLDPVCLLIEVDVKENMVDLHVDVCRSHILRQ